LLSVVGRISEEGVRHRQCSVADHDGSGCRLPNLPARQSLFVTHMDVCMRCRRCSTGVVVDASRRENSTLASRHC